jgi:hypothetical protein
MLHGSFLQIIKLQGITRRKSKIYLQIGWHVDLFLSLICQTLARVHGCPKRFVTFPKVVFL